MADACNPAHLPGNTNLTAGYINGVCKWPDSAASANVKINVAYQVDDGDVLDVERGDATPAEAPGWVVMRRRSGAWPSVYMNASTWAAVRNAFIAAGVVEPPYWVAWYGHAPVIPKGAVALQYANSIAPGYDLSIVADYWPGVDDMTPEQSAKLDQISAQMDEVHSWLSGNPFDKATTIERLVDELHSWASAVPPDTLDKFSDILARVKDLQSKANP